VFVGVGSVVGGLVAARSGTPLVFVLAAGGVLAAAGVNLALARQERAQRAPVDARRGPDADVAGAEG
jgi:predicted MFS family arabinose efflux permease